jgi:type V secretory pathway adhesin AidA
VVIYNASGVAVTSATVDESGNYTSFNGLTTGTYYAVASGEGFFTQLYQGTNCSNCNVTSGTAISVTLGATKSGINFSLNSSQAIASGKVTDASTGSPLGGVLVVFYDSSGTRFTCRLRERTTQ